MARCFNEAAIDDPGARGFDPPVRVGNARVGQVEAVELVAAGGEHAPIEQGRAAAGIEDLEAAARRYLPRHLSQELADLAILVPKRGVVFAPIGAGCEDVHDTAFHGQSPPLEPCGAPTLPRPAPPYE